MDTQPMSTEAPLNHRRHWSIAVRAAITLSILAYLVYKIDWSLLARQMERADPRWLGLACLLFGITSLLGAVRWWLLLRVQDIALPWLVVTAITLIGQFFNTFMLGSVGGDIVRAMYAQKYSPDRRTHATLSVVMDRAIGLFVLVSGSLVAIPWQLRSMLATEEAHAAVVGLIVVFVIVVIGTVAVAIMPFHLAPPRLRELWSKIPGRRVIELVVTGFRQHGNALKLTLASLAVGVVLMLVLNLAGYCIAVGIGLHVTYMQLLVIMTVTICVISLPISIGGHGVREGTFVLMFAAFGVTSVEGQTDGVETAAVLFSLLFFAIPLVWSVAGGFVYLTFRHDYPSVQPILRSAAGPAETGRNGG